MALPSGYEVHARRRKVRAIVAVLRHHGADAEDTELIALSPLGRDMVERLAEVNPASDHTWGLVVNDMRAREFTARDAADVVEMFDNPVGFGAPQPEDRLPRLLDVVGQLVKHGRDDQQAFPS